MTAALLTALRQTQIVLLNIKVLLKDQASIHEELQVMLFGDLKQNRINHYRRV